MRYPGQVPFDRPLYCKVESRARRSQSFRAAYHSRNQSKLWLNVPQRSLPGSTIRDLDQRRNLSPFAGRSPCPLQGKDVSCTLPLHDPALPHKTPLSDAAQTRHCPQALGDHVPCSRASSGGGLGGRRSSHSESMDDLEPTSSLLLSAIYQQQARKNHLSTGVVQPKMIPLRWRRKSVLRAYDAH